MCLQDYVIYVAPFLQGWMPSGHSIKIVIGADFEQISLKTFPDKCIYVPPSYNRKNKGSRETF